MNLFQNNSAKQIDNVLAQKYRMDMPDYNDLSDDELIAKCVGKDPEAWETLVRRYQRLVASITVKFRLSHEDSADVMQSVWLALFQQLPQVKKQSKLGSWLITVTVRECWRLRSRSGKAELLGESEWQKFAEEMTEGGDMAESETLTYERQQLLRQELKKLTPRCQRLIAHMFFLDTPTSYADISKKMRIPIPSIGPTRMRCLNKLRVALEKLGFD